MLTADVPPVSLLARLEDPAVAAHDRGLRVRVEAEITHVGVYARLGDEAHPVVAFGGR